MLWLAVLACPSPQPARADAGAPQRGLALNWVRLAGAEQCIAPVELALAVEQRLGARVFVPPSDALVVIEGRVLPNAPLGYRAQLEFTDPDGRSYGSRELTLAAADCRKLDALLTLVIALAVHGGADSVSAGIELPPEIARELDRLFEQDDSELPAPPLAAGPASSAPAQSEPVSTAGPAPVHDAPVQPEALQSHWELAVGMAAVSGALPAWAFSPSVGAAFALEGIGSVGVVVRAALPQTQRVSSDEPGTLHSGTLQAGLQLCSPALRAGRMSVAGCGAASLTRLRVDARGFQVYKGHELGYWLELEPRLHARVSLWGPSYVQLALGLPIRTTTMGFAYKSRTGEEIRAFDVSRLGPQIELMLGLGW